MRDSIIKGRQCGFTLIELMISMLMSLILVLACTTLYSSLKSSILLAQDLSNAQESLRGSFYLMSRSVRQADSFTITGGSTLAIIYDTPPTSTEVYSCLGNVVSAAGATDTYSSDGDGLYCDDGSGSQLIALDVTDIQFATITGTNYDGLQVTIKIDGLPDTYDEGISFNLALRQKILLEIDD